MRLTKRQLKRIIREEYSRLKRRGLIRESRMDPEIRRSLNMFEDQLVRTCGEQYQRGELSDALQNDMFEGDGIFSCEMVLDVCTDPQLKQKIMRFCERAVGQAGNMYEPESDMYESRRRRHSLLTEMGQNFDRALSEVEMMIKACKAAGVPISYEEEKRYFEGAYFGNHIDPELYKKYDQCQGQ